jgi:2-succinyl-5-enolpyruvyl-6-hydroxy-3-cyclohexene-1-carboxylate synthase
VTVGLGDVSLACAASLVDELVAAGVRIAAVSPGSRSTALALAFDRDPRIAVHVHLDERSGAFFALGAAKASGGPAAVVCTSGTAAAEFFPAVVEAERSRTPLVLLTADRPPRLRGTGANQTIDQVELFGRYARRYVEPPVPSGPADETAWREAGRTGVAGALEEPRGPVQINCPFEEPLVPDEPPAGRDGDVAGSNQWVDGSAGDVDVRDDEGTDDDLDRLFGELGSRKGVILVGAMPHPRTLSLLSLGAMLGWPVLAEPLSGLRLFASPIVGSALSAGQFLIGNERWLAAHMPEVVLQVGATPTARASLNLVAGVADLVVLDRRHPDPDPQGRASWRIRRDPERFAARGWDRFADHDRASDPGWLDEWHRGDLVARHGIDRVLDEDDRPWEGRLARDLASHVPGGAVLVVGSSMPVRDLDAYMQPRRLPRMWTGRDLLRFVANRGASGIDGMVATALGAASTGLGPTYGLLGDLTVLHDAGSLLWSARGGPDVVLVVATNGEGTIFSFLGQRGLPELERLFTTPHRIDLGSLSHVAGASHRRLDRASDLGAALVTERAGSGVHLVEVVIDPDLNRERHADARHAAAAALGSMT